MKENAEKMGIKTNLPPLRKSVAGSEKESQFRRLKKAAALESEAPRVREVQQLGKELFENDQEAVKESEHVEKSDKNIEKQGILNMTRYKK